MVESVLLVRLLHCEPLIDGVYPVLSLACGILQIVGAIWLKRGIEKWHA